MTRRAPRTVSVTAFLCLSSGLAAQGAAARPQLPDDYVATMHWRSIGPANMGGRITSLAVYENEPSTFYVATATGGLLKTVNNGITFEHQFDHEATVAIGDVSVSASDPNIVWVGTGEENPRNSVSYGDGVYKSTDGGKTWKNMGLEESFQIGDIEIHPENPDIVFVAALGRLYGPNQQRGLFKTTDGGATWENVLYIDDKTGALEIAMHPEDPDTMLVATYERKRDGFDTNDPSVKIGPGSGLYRTTDGGATFDKVTEGLPTCDLGRIGLDWYRKDPNVVYAVVESEMMGKARKNMGWPGLTVSDAETGARVTRVVAGGPADEAGLKVDDIVLSVGGETVLEGAALTRDLLMHDVGEAVELEVARDGESVMVTLTLAEYDAELERAGRRNQGGGAGGPGRFRGRGRGRGFDYGSERPFGGRLGGQRENIQDLQGTDGAEYGGLYRSDDAGLSWTRINSIDPRPMYFSQVRVDPSDNELLYVLGVSAGRSVDGGKTFTIDASRGVHSDQHALWIDPNNGDHMLIGTDGGLYATYDRCANWDHLNHMALGQFYHVAVGPRRDYWVYGGLQDNGTWGAPNRARRGSGAINEDWIRVGSGDGFVVQVDPDDPDQIYYESQNGGMGRTHLVTMEGGRIRPGGGQRGGQGGGQRGGQRGERQRERIRFNWRTPFILSNHNPRIYYCAGNKVFRSLNKGDNLKAISPEITMTDRGSATALSESPRDPDVLYVGTDDGAFWMTRDGGLEWLNLWEVASAADIGDEAEISQGGPRADESFDESLPLAELMPGPRWVASLEASRFKAGRCYVAFDGHRSDDDQPYALVTEDYGQSWQTLHGSLPRGSTRVLREDITDENILYLGTEFGLWVSLDRGGHWTRLHNNLPTVPVHEVAQHPTSGEIIAATHGRSLWILDATVLRQMHGAALADEVHLYKPNNAVLWRRQHRRASSGARGFTGENPASGAQIYYSLERPAQEVAITVHDASGAVLAKLDGKTEAGLHMVSWNLRARSRRRDLSNVPAEFRRFARSRGAMAKPGTYKVVLDVDGEASAETLEVEPDPNL